MKILAIDPGPVNSYYVVWNSETEKLIAISKTETRSTTMPIGSGKNKIKKYPYVDNVYLMNITDWLLRNHKVDVVAIEALRPYGQRVGLDTFNTIFFTGRLCQAFVQDMRRFDMNPRVSMRMIPRRDVKLHLCGVTTAKDADIRDVLRERFGEPGTKNEPGKLYGIKADLWQALALAVTVGDQNILTEHWDG